jgi:hypothetical protein
MTPPQALLQENLINAAALDRDRLLLVEVGLESVKCPAGERQAQFLGIGQGGGEDLGALLGGVGVRPTGSGLIAEPGQAVLVEAMNPGVDRGSADTELVCDRRGPATVGGGHQDASSLDKTS